MIAAGRPSRRRWLGAAAALALFASGRGTAAAGFGSLQAVALPDVARIDPAAVDGWLARDRAGRLWQVGDDATTRLLGDGVAPQGSLAVGHGRIAGRSLDGRLWVRTDNTSPPQSSGSSVVLAPHGGLCVLPAAVIGLVEHAGHAVLARLEPDGRGRWEVVARSAEPVLPDAVPLVADLDGRGDGGHIALLAGPDRDRYPHAALGDDVEATRVLWLERHSLQPLRTLGLDAPHVFEDRQLRPWRLPDGRLGLVTMRAGPLGAQLAVVAASAREASALEIAAAGPPIGTRNRWLAPASVDPGDRELWAVHTPHIGSVLHRYRVEGAGLTSTRMASGLTNHRLGARDLDVTARIGQWLLLPLQGWHQVAVVDLGQGAVIGTFAVDGPVLQLAASPSRRRVAVLTSAGMSLYAPPSDPRRPARSG